MSHSGTRSMLTAVTLSDCCLKPLRSPSYCSSLKTRLDGDAKAVHEAQKRLSPHCLAMGRCLVSVALRLSAFQTRLEQRYRLALDIQPRVVRLVTQGYLQLGYARVSTYGLLGYCSRRMVIGGSRRDLWEKNMLS
jgi:hypothetical protein